MSAVADPPINRVIARRLAEFVDRTAEMAVYARMLDQDDLPIMVIFAESGMGKTSLLLRMIHECSLRKLRTAEVVWSDTLVYDYMAVLRKLRDDLGVGHFVAFTDLINYYTDASYSPQLNLNITAPATVRVAEGAQMSASSVGDIAGVIVRDNMIVVQRPDIAVPLEVRREQLTHLFLDGLQACSCSERVVIFFDAVEKMSDITNRWVWEQLLPPIRDSVLPNVRIVICGQRPPPRDRDWTDFVACAELKPLGQGDISAYIAKRIAGRVELSEQVCLELATMLLAFTRGRPADVASSVDLYLASRSQGP